MNSIDTGAAGRHGLPPTQLLERNAERMQGARLLLLGVPKDPKVVSLFRQESGVLLTSQGEVRVGVATTRLSLPTASDDSVRSMVAAPDGTVYVGTGGETAAGSDMGGAGSSRPAGPDEPWGGGYDGPSPTTMPVQPRGNGGGAAPAADFPGGSSSGGELASGAATPPTSGEAGW